MTTSLDKLKTLQDSIKLLDGLIEEEHFSRPSRQREQTVLASCEACRRAKAKCTGDRVTTCPRCSKNDLPCRYPEKRAPGRSAGFGKRALQLTELRSNLQDCLGALDPTATPTSTLASVSAAATPVASTSKLPPASAERSRMRRSSEGLEDLAEPLSNPLSLLASISLRGTSEAPNGDFETWLEASQRYYGSGKELYCPRYDTDPLCDPVVLGLLTADDLARLVNLYFNKLRPFLWLLTRSIHTPDRLRNTSPFLTTCLAAAAAMYCPQSGHLVAGLQAHAEWLSCRVYSGRYRSREIVYAYEFMAHWNPPGESWSSESTWRWIGEAVRMGQELRLDRPLDRAAFAVEQARNPLHDDLYETLAEDHARGWSLLFCADLAISVHTGRMATFSALRLKGGLRGDLPVPAPSEETWCYSNRANEVLNRRFAKALVLLSGLEEEDGDKADLRSSFTASWKADLHDWAQKWPKINTFIAVHAQHVRILLLAASLALPGPTRPILEEVQAAALTLVTLVGSWSEDAEDSVLFASNYVVNHIAFGATLLLKFIDLSDFTQRPEVRAHVLELCAKIVSALLKVAAARVNAPSIASIHAARIHSLLLTFTAPPPTPVAIPQPVLGFEDFSIGLEGTTVGTLLDSLADQDGQAAWSWNDWSMTPMQDTEWGLWGAES